MLFAKSGSQAGQSYPSLTNLFIGLLDICQLSRIISVVLSLLSTASFAYSDLVVLGDSLSDTGNHPAALLGSPYPYYQNRVSNGPVAVDILAAGLGLSAANSGHIFGNGNGSNYAVSGANAGGNEAHGLHAQLDAFLAGRQAIDSQALYLIMIGGNDVRDAAVIENMPVALAQVYAAASAIKQATEQLIQAGAKYIVVSNVPDISKIPETTDRAPNNPGILQRAQQLSIAFNQRLNQHLSALSTTPRVKILNYDFYTRFNELLASPSHYGFNNTAEACFDNSPYSFHPQCNFERFVFFDSIHPTAKSHRLIGEKLLELVKASKVIGLPGIMLLLLD